ncbi:MAG: hypothetical protein Q8Q92_04730 [bacterium]|nr:hypothetical protein [bacterium]
MNETDKLIEEQVKTLPPNLREAINTVSWKNLVQEIGKQNNLSPEKIESLEQETMFIIYGFENPVDYPTNIIRELNISEKMAYAIVESVTNKIFDPILNKSNEYEKGVTPVFTPETPPTNLPMVEKGEVAHTVDSKQYTVDREKQATEKVKVSLPDYRYEGGKDPYREPLG